MKRTLPPSSLMAPATVAQGGFTLVELLITVVAFAIIVGLAVPAFRSFLQNDRQWMLQNSLVLALNAARSEAIKQDSAKGVQVCASVSGTACDGASWAQGWIVLNPSAPPPNSQVIQSVGALPANTTLTEGNNNLSVTFLSNGSINSPVAFSFTLCDARGGTHARYLQVNPMGRVAASQKVGYDLNNPAAALVCP
jgi:type IV fimbrial biogenesis protein FimT